MSRSRSDGDVQGLVTTEDLLSVLDGEFLGAPTP